MMRKRFSYSVDTRASWLTLYFFFNLALTLYNKGILIRFPFPYTLTAMHALCGSVGGYVLMEQGYFQPKHLSVSDNLVLLAFSVLYTINIAVSNISLELVTVPFHQVVRAATPIFTMLISAALFRTTYSSRKIISLVPVVGGVGFATYGDYYFTRWGLILTLLGTMLAALKTVFTNVLQSPNFGSSSSAKFLSVFKLKGADYYRHPANNGRHATGAGNGERMMMLGAKGYDLPTENPTAVSSPLAPPSLSAVAPTPNLQLHPLDLLTRMSPLAFIQCVIFAHFSGELERVRHYSAHEMTRSKAIVLVANGVLAFGLNVVSFTANKKVGPLSMTVAANVKQVLTIVLAIIFFHLSISFFNAIGIGLTLFGGAWYAYVEYTEKKKRQHSPSLSLSLETGKTSRL